jgi:hypothetical protein
MMRPKFGTLEWSKKNNGALTPTERLHFLRNMAFPAAREASDAERHWRQSISLPFAGWLPHERFSKHRSRLAVCFPANLDQH